MKKLTLILFIGLLSVACSKKADAIVNNNPTDTTKQNPIDTVKYDTTYIHLRLGLPKDADSSDDYIIKRNQYAISYNYKKNEANWVSWCFFPLKIAHFNK